MRAWALLGLLLVTSCASTGTVETSAHPQRLLVPSADSSPEATSPVAPETIGGKGKGLDPTTRIVVAAPAPAVVRVAPAPRMRPPSR
ncbi:MAG: hypothetical protein ACLQBL_32520 [Polyangiaceae bacterium]|jgi:hypothetical protein